MVCPEASFRNAAAKKACSANRLMAVGLRGSKDWSGVLDESPLGIHSALGRYHSLRKYRKCLLALECERVPTTRRRIPLLGHTLMATTSCLNMTEIVVGAAMKAMLAKWLIQKPSAASPPASPGGVVWRNHILCALKHQARSLPAAIDLRSRSYSP